MSHAADRSSGKNRKMLLTDVKKSPLNSKSADAVFIELSEEVGCSARQGDKASGVGSVDSDQRRRRERRTTRINWMGVGFTRRMALQCLSSTLRRTSIWWFMEMTSRSVGSRRR